MNPLAIDTVDVAKLGFVKVGEAGPQQAIGHSLK